jgi:cytochrome c oxidase subunit 2
VSALLATSPSLLDGAGKEGRHVAGLAWFMFATAAAVYVFVAAMVVIALVRRTRQEGPDTSGDRTNFIWWGGVAMPIVILGVLAYLTVSTTTALGRDAPAALRVDVTGHDWWWDVRYPDSGVRTANEIHLPVGRTVDLALRSVDLIHSFWVPQLAGKLDLVPGQTNHLRLQPERTGTFLGECAEFCGLQHANMRFVVVVQTTADYARWSASGGTARPTSAAAGRGARLFQEQPCAGCHTIRGTQAAGTYGPDLTDVGSRRWLAAKTLRNTPDDLLRWIRDPDAVKPGVLMPPSPLSDAQLRDLVAYLESLR